MEILFFVVIVILASLAGGIVGFGSSLIAMPLILTFLGDKMSQKLPQKLFRILVIIIIFFSGAYSIFSGLR